METITTGLTVYNFDTISNLECNTARLTEMKTAVNLATVPSSLVLFLVPCVIWEIVRTVAAECAFAR